MAITPQGKSKWTFKAGREIKSSPAVADDGTIYFGSRDRRIFTPSHPMAGLKWTFPTGAWIDSSPAIGADGTIYFGSWDPNFYALNSRRLEEMDFRHRQASLIRRLPSVLTGRVISDRMIKDFTR